MPVLRGRRFAAVLRMIGLSKVGEGEEGGTGMWGRCRAKLLRQGNKLFCRKMPAVEASPWKPRDIIPPLFVVGGRRRAWKEIERFMLGCVDSRYV